MVSLIGTFTLASAVICSLFSVIGFFLSLISKNRSNFYNRNARILNYLSAFSILAAFIVLEVGLFQRDYSIQYVYEHTANSTSKLFTFTGVWAGLEGSLLLWALILCVFSVATLMATRKKERKESVTRRHFSFSAVNYRFFGIFLLSTNFYIIITVCKNECQL